jgi:hypothetical protein
MAHIPREQVQPLFAEALGSHEPFAALLKLAEALVGQGVPTSELYAVFQVHLIAQSNASDEKLYNALADVMDRICGWCGPEASLYKPVTGQRGPT